MSLGIVSTNCARKNRFMKSIEKIDISLIILHKQDGQGIFLFCATSVSCCEEDFELFFNFDERQYNRYIKFNNKMNNHRRNGYG